MEEILKILEDSDNKFWDEFLERAAKIQEAKFSLKFCKSSDTTIYWIRLDGHRKWARDLALSKE